MRDLLAASALDQAAAVRAGEVSAVELVEAALRAAEDAAADLDPFTVIDADRALAAAATIADGDPRPFAGLITIGQIEALVGRGVSGSRR